LGRGDCTAHARLFAAFATARGHRVRLVTGLRLDDTDGAWRLVRHRWVAVELEGQWIQVDPTYAEVPARARLFGLAVHGASTAELALVDEVAFAGIAGARAAFR
jgi:transglutaminase-like putative cysteine protease